MPGRVEPLARAHVAKRELTRDVRLPQAVMPLPPSCVVDVVSPSSRPSGTCRSPPFLAAG
jgi:hypothetical protein